jgi:uncharacterized membrane protein
MESVVALAVLAVLAIPVLLIVALSSLSTVKRRLGTLEEEVDRLRMQVALQTPPREPRAAPAAAREPHAVPSATPMGERVAQPTPPAPPVDAKLPPAAAEPRAPEALPTGPRRPYVRPVPQPSLFDVGMRALQRWFTVGNVPVKIGMLVLLAGVAALLKYASDQGWLHAPIEVRLAGVALAAVAALVFGWRQRQDKRAFALALQGGAIGVLLLTVFAAFKLYALLPAGAAFALSITLVAGLGVLAVAQDSRTLAVLGVLAGFLAPIWLSTGGGSHVALFSYYAVLNAAIFGIAWMRSWRILNLLGFVFTWGIGTAWGVLQYDSSKLATTEPFLLLFFAFYLALPLLQARRRALGSDRLDGCLVFGTPLVAFSLQAGLLRGDRMSLALCALALAALYAGLAWVQLRRRGDAVLGQSHALLAAGFATLAVPLALSARATAAVFALEGAGVAWLGVRQDRRLPQWSGAALQLAAAFAFSVGQPQWSSDLHAVANPTCMGALLIAVAGFASAWAYRSSRGMASAYYLWGLAWWCGNALHEVDRFVIAGAQADALLAFAAATGWLAAEVHRRHAARALAATSLAAFVVAVPLAFAQTEVHQSPFAANGAWAWLAFAILGVRTLVCLRANADRVAAWAQFAWWLVWPIALSLLAWQVAERFALADGWRLGLSALPWLAITGVSLLRWPWLSAPQGARFDAYRGALQGAFFAALALWWASACLAAADAAPLPWLPGLNPVELTQIATLVLLARWLWSHEGPDGLKRGRLGLLAASSFVLVSCMTLRAVHHWGGIAWDHGLLSTSLAQASLTVVWSVLGVIGWIAGSRRGQRALWLAGAVLMAVVLAKLVLVDRQQLGNLLGIGSFIAYGLLCTLVGYFAPAPPRAAAPVAGEVPA